MWAAGDEPASLWPSAPALGGDHWLAFQDQDPWYLAPHDELVSEVHGITPCQTAESWLSGGNYSFPGLSSETSAALKTFRVKGRD
ncbi:hypothetical protein DESA109040_06835 [Deinococcus saxicola]